MRIYVINLARAEKRRRHVVENFDRLKIDFNFFEAVDGFSGLPQSLAGKPDDAFREKYRGRPLTPGEKGVYASHYLLWQKCVDLDEPIVVLEDDFLPTVFFDKIIKKLPELHNKYQYLRLEPQDSNFDCKFIEGTADGFQIVMWMDNAGGARGYSITPKAAKAFIENSHTWLCAVDNFIGEPYRHRVPSMGLLPYAVFNSNMMESQIQDKVSLSKVKFKFKILRELFRIYRQIRLGLWNLSFKVEK
jgi:glycosyl transferase, family 25